ncbi:Spt20 family-domain-containing protein [Calycina marina]|uniref:Spt20 family-domain-containing protein n=1 Tax=Calycina marina TaxID=1763456 RepID=A0A9P7ZCH0_9HELO|nr:Spt20 family-domain-containing protein [Calycina marina]
MSNSIGGSSSSARSANRSRKEAQVQILGRGQRNNSAGLRSASIVADMAVPHSSAPQPYIKTKEYILKKYKGNPPSIIIHMHAMHFKFDKQEGSFSYKSPMALMLSHLKSRTIPHDLVDFFASSNVAYYEGCLIIQIHDHKTTVATRGTVCTNAGSGKTAPFSIHRSNAYLTPSSYVPFPRENQSTKARSSSNVDSDASGKSKSVEQKDKEDMPAPAVPDSQRDKSGGQTKSPKIYTVVLHPTSASKHADLAITALDNRLDNVASRQDPAAGGPTSATVPPTPSNAILPPTPHTSMAPSTKKLKRMKSELDAGGIHAAEAQIIFATTAPLYLEPANSSEESAAVLDALSHPMHSAKPPSPKARKRTVAEMEADEAQAADEERYMLALDERLSSTVGAQGGANPAENDGQAGCASFEPRFEKFKTIENIKANHEELEKARKARQAEDERKAALDRERERLQKEAEKRDHEKMRQNLINNSTAQRKQQHDPARRALMVQQMNSQAAVGNVPAQGQHAHPQNNGGINGAIHSQPQRFQQVHQQVSGPGVSSPIARNGTPMNHSSPSVNNMSMPVQTTNSSMAGSPSQPNSVVHQNQVPNNVSSQGMVPNRSQQSHAGTPMLSNATPNMHNTPINRAISQTPRMGQASPPQGQMAQVPMQMMNNGQQPNMAQQQAMLQQQAMRQHQLQQQQQASMATANGQPITQTQHQQRLMTLQAMAAQQAAAQQGNHMPNPNMMAGNYAQMQAMQRLQAIPQGGMPQNMAFSQGMPQNMQGVNMQQMQNLQQMRQQAAQQVQHQQIQAAQQAQGQGRPPHTPQQMIVAQISRQTQQLYVQGLNNLVAQYGGNPQNIPPNIAADLKTSCNQQAIHMVTSNMRKRQLMAQQQQMQQMQNMGMQNHGM